jgi:hypothetical protein
LAKLQIDTQKFMRRSLLAQQTKACWEAVLLPLPPKLGRGGRGQTGHSCAIHLADGIVRGGRGAKAQGPRQRPAKLELNLAIRSSDEKEANHGNEEEKEEEDGEAGSRKVTTQARAEFASRPSCGS